MTDRHILKQCSVFNHPAFRSHTIQWPNQNYFSSLSQNLALHFSTFYCNITVSLFKVTVHRDNLSRCLVTVNQLTVDESIVIDDLSLQDNKYKLTIIFSVSYSLRQNLVHLRSFFLLSNWTVQYIIVGQWMFPHLAIDKILSVT